MTGVVPIDRRNFIRGSGAGLILAAAAASTACSQKMPAAAIEAWNGPPEQADIRRWILGYAILAPSSHNLQPWRVDLATPGEVLLRCDLERLLPQADPFSRQIMMSHGTFLELFDIAARERGIRAEITLFPEGEFGPHTLDERPVARIRLRPDSSVRRDALFGAILNRHTNRNEYDLQRPVPAASWSAMTEAIQPNRLHMGFVGVEHSEELARHRAIAAEAWRIELGTPRVMLETYKVLRVGANEIDEFRDGLSVLDPLVVWLNRVGLFDRSQPPAPGEYATTKQINDFGEKLDSTPGFFWMVTQANDRMTQIGAGRAYARVQLAATANGLAMQPLQQALQEYQEQALPRAELKQLLNVSEPGRTVQMWARLGYALPVDPAPRRSAADHLI